MAIKIIPYRQASKSAKALARALGGKILLIEGSRYVPVPHDVLINWGNTSTSLPGLLNPPVVIKRVSNKKTFFEMMSLGGLGSLLPEFWISKDIPTEKYPVVCRGVLSGHSGEGITISKNSSGLIEARLYTRYHKKSCEYRIHLGMLGEEVLQISVQQKKRRLDHPNPDWKVRNHQNGFIYARADIQVPEIVMDYAKRVFVASGLDFGAVDVIYSNKTGETYVLEINTAPGLEGTTVEDYETFFRAKCLQ